MDTAKVRDFSIGKHASITRIPPRAGRDRLIRIELGGGNQVQLSLFRIVI
jgi:hypothetical protein